MDIANPIAMIASLGMALKYSLDQKVLSDRIDHAIKEFIAKGYRTKDISTNDEYVKTSEVASILIGILKNG
jgi:3-isopropylmalate dehydrogenase